MHQNSPPLPAANSIEKNSKCQKDVNRSISDNHSGNDLNGSSDQNSHLGNVNNLSKSTDLSVDKTSDVSVGKLATPKPETKELRPLPLLYLVVPAYNEESVLPLSLPRLLSHLQRWKDEGLCQPDSRLLIVDDGSTDKSWDTLCELQKQESSLQLLRLRKNAGHQNALFAGLCVAKSRCDVSLSLDADLQDDLNALPAFLRAYREGADVVYGVRKNRETDSRFKAVSAELFYKFQRFLGLDVVENHADCRLLSRAAMDELCTLTEQPLYLRGLVPLLGFPSATVYYDRQQRLAGETKYSLWSMLRLAKQGIFGFSSVLLDWMLPTSLFFLFVSLLLWLTSLFRFHLFPGLRLQYFLFFLISLLFFALSLLAPYIQQIHNNVLARPRFSVAEFLERAPKRISSVSDVSSISASPETASDVSDQATNKGSLAK